MRRIQFALSDQKYERVKKKLLMNHLTWQKVCEQMADHLLTTEFLDESGLAVQEMSPSVLRKVKSEIEGHFETAAWKYIQIQFDPKENKNHWRAALRSALKQVIKSNSYKEFKRGYIYEEEELETMLQSMWDGGKRLASGHLGIPIGYFDRIEKPTVQELFNYAEVSFALKISF